MQSSAYIPLWKHDKRLNLLSLIILRATLQRCPSFSNSPRTQSVTYGIAADQKILWMRIDQPCFSILKKNSKDAVLLWNEPFAYKQSINPCIISILYLIEKLTKFVSIIIWNGGPSWVLYFKNIAVDTWGLKITGWINANNELKIAKLSLRKRKMKTYASTIFNACLLSLFFLLIMRSLSLL